MRNFKDLVSQIYSESPVSLHRPKFDGNEKKYLVECIDSNFVSSVGQRVVDFETSVAKFTGARFAIATVNGTAALHISMLLAKIKPGDEVITQALTFVATSNAITYSGALPVFIDVDRDTMGMSPLALRKFLESSCEKRDGVIKNRISGRRIAGCVPMHTFGFPCRIKEIVAICNEWGIPLIEDAAESLGSYVGEQHTGNFGLLATLSFNGNKIITSGGGGMILTNDEMLAQQAKHLTTTAKIPHAFEFIHDEIGYNYRMPNLNAALGCAQLEQLMRFLQIKADIAKKYAKFFQEFPSIKFIFPILGSRANYWLNTIILESPAERDAWLAYTNANGIMTRPIWRLMSSLPMFKNCQHDGLKNSYWLESRVLNIPSSVPDGLVTPIYA